ncbi:MAG TPA: ABC transporter transmembrane domain-containing protein, partial [Polyangiales bacterium]|nr:ABC transporter transmembrane domain-containing protein [Polyangiales bacterium]
MARAILANPKVLVLDDATSAIDAQTEEAIHRSLDSVMQDRTTIIIAHRQSTLRLTTRVVVLEAGRVVADGTHQELLASSALYRELLAGPELEADALETVLRDASAVPEIDPQAWPAHAAKSALERSASVDSAVSLAAMKSVQAGAGGGGGGRDFGGGRAAFVAETPELLARVAQLPPAVGEPNVPVEELTVASTRFSLRALLRRFRASLLFGFALVVVDAATTLAAPLLIGRGVDRGIVANNREALWFAAAALFGVQMLSWINASGMQFQTARTAERLLFALRVRTFAHLQWLSLDYYDREVGGKIMTRMTTDIEAFAQLLQQGLLTAVVSLLSCV